MIVIKSTQKVVEDDDYIITHTWDGVEEQLSFKIPVENSQNFSLNERSKVVVTETKKEYRIISKKSSNSTYDYIAEIDLSDLKSDMHLSYTNDSNTPGDTISIVLPVSWTLIDNSGISSRRTIKGDGYTCLDVIEACLSTWSNLAVQYNSGTKVVILYNTENMQDTGVYLTDELNLRSRPTYTGIADEMYTRIYPVGAEGLTVSSVNSGKDYIDNNYYTDEIISYFWKDERYTIAQNLYDDAVAKLSKACIPSISYELDIVDLAKKNPELWAFQEMQLYKTVTLLDGYENKKIKHKVVKYEEHAKGHESENKITLSTLPQKMSSKVRDTYSSLNDSSSEYQSKVEAKISSMDKQVSDLITGASGGHIVINFGSDGKTAEFLCMDTADKATAKNVIRLNNSGMAFSTSGYNGPFNAAIDITGKLMAQWVSTWNLTANIITAGVLKSVSGTSYFDLNSGKVQLTGNLQSVSGSLIAKIWGGVFNMLRGNNEFVGLSSSASDDNNGVGVINVWEWLNGTGTIKTQIAGGSLTTRDIFAERVTLSSFYPTNDADSNCRWVWSGTLGGYVLSTSTSLK